MSFTRVDDLLGAWADASSWNGEVVRLQRDGYVVRALAKCYERR